MSYVKWLFRPVILFAVSVALVTAATLVVLRPPVAPPRPQPAALAPGEQEIAFLYPATSNSWDRFVVAVQRARERLQSAFPGLRCCHEPAVPPGPADAPTIALEWPAVADAPPRRLVFRWYKLTGDWKIQEWVEALLDRPQPPLAVISGSTSYWARQAAVHLNRGGAERPLAAHQRPLLLLTTATADFVAPADLPGAGDPAAEVPGSEERLERLHSLYRERTFRFCFSNRQMATAVTHFLWARLDLRPDSDPAFFVRWDDDSYSRDLAHGYRRVLARRASDNALQQMAWLSGQIALGAPAPTLAGWYTSGFRNEVIEQLPVYSSVGPFAAPNRYEADAVRELLDRLQQAREGDPDGMPGPRRPLLVVTGQTAPSRRFLRELARSDPDTARSFVVAMGDALAFNTVYRDRRVTWPIQDLPFDLLFFCHRNPIDESAGFRPVLPGERPPPAAATSGTEDLLLYGDIVEAVALAMGDDATDLAEGLLRVRQHNGHLTLGPDGAPLFRRQDGQREAGTGDHVVHLRPQFHGGRVLPEAVIEVWRRGDRTSGGGWQPAGRPLRVTYREGEAYGGD